MRCRRARARALALSLDARRTSPSSPPRPAPRRRASQRLAGGREPHASPDGSSPSALPLRTVTESALRRAWPEGSLKDAGAPPAALAAAAASGDDSALRLCLAAARAGNPLPDPASRVRGGVGAVRFMHGDVSADVSADADAGSGGGGGGGGGGGAPLLCDGGDLFAVLSAVLGAPRQVTAPRLATLSKHCGVLAFAKPRSKAPAAVCFQLWDGATANTVGDFWGESDAVWLFALPA